MFSGEKGVPLLVLSISGKEIALKGPKVHEILDMIDACCREALGRGFFPYGSDAAAVTIVSHSLGMTGANGGANLSSSGIVSAAEDGNAQLHDSKKLMRSFLHTFPMLPRPPIPESAHLATTGAFSRFNFILTLLLFCFYNNLFTLLLFLAVL